MCKTDLPLMATKTRDAGEAKAPFLPASLALASNAERPLVPTADDGLHLVARLIVTGCRPGLPQLMSGKVDDCHREL